MGELDFEDREIALQVLAAASEQMTKRQVQCLLLCCQGYTQAEVAGVLGITQPAAHYHFTAALEKVREVAPRYL
jgi:DNA-binding CsgD family transcriptional regulator